MRCSTRCHRLPSSPARLALVAAMLGLAGSWLDAEAQTPAAQGPPTAPASATPTAPGCPPGTQRRLDPATQRPRCERRTPVFKDATCDPGHAEFVVYRALRGRDVCVRTEDASLSAAQLSASSPRARPVRCLSEVRLDLAWQLEVDRDQLRDRCRADRVEWIDPVPPQP